MLIINAAKLASILLPTIPAMASSLDRAGSAQRNYVVVVESAADLANPLLWTELPPFSWKKLLMYSGPSLLMCIAYVVSLILRSGVPAGPARALRRASS